MTRQTNPLRAFLAGLLLLVGVLMVPASLASIWIRNTAMDTESFVNLYQPLAGKSDFQTFIATEVSDTAANVVESSGLLETVGASAGELDRFLGQFGVELGLADTAADWSKEAADKVRQTVYDQTMPMVQSAKFRQVWTDSLRQIHSQVIAGLDGSGDGVLSVEAAPFVDLLRDNLEKRGYSLASFIPSPDDGTRITIAQIELNPRAQQAYSLLSEYGQWLPWANLAILLLGVIIANRQSRALSRAAFGTAVLSGLLWWGAPRLGSLVLVDTVAAPGGNSVARLFWQVGVAPLQEMALWVAAGALGLAVVAFLFHSLTKRD